MYFYLYDAFLREKKFEVPIARIEGRLFDLGIQGKSEKLTILKSMKELVDGAMKRGVDTVVAVGNDETLSKMIHLIADRDVILGFLPIGGKSTIGSMLGIPSGERACDVLSARIIERLDLGRANEIPFLSFLALTPAPDIQIECNETYTVQPHGAHHISVLNFGYTESDPHDGLLELVLAQEGNAGRGVFGNRQPRDRSVFPVRTLRVRTGGKSIAAYADGQTVVKTPLSVRVENKKLRMIVGKARAFSVA